MADPLSISASIIALLQASGTILQYIKSVKDANKDIKTFQVEMINIRGLLFSLQDLLSDLKPGETSLLPVFESLGGENGALKQFKTTLEDLVSKLGPKEYSTMVGKVVSWHFKKDDVKNLLSTIERYKTLFTLVLQRDQLDLTRLVIDNIGSLRRDTTDVKIEVLSIQKSLEDDKYRKILEWFSSIDVSTNHDAARKNHEPSTGEWFIQSSDFMQWKNDPNGFFWLYGFPGSGKTVLCSTIIQETKLFVERDPTRVLAYFYFDFRNKEKQNVPGFLRSLIAQLSIASKILPDEIETLYSQNTAPKPPLSDIRALVRILKSILADQRQVYIITDALDECTEREDLLEVLSEITNMEPGKLHILVTSRHERDILEGLEGIATRRFSLGGSKIDKDIALYVHNEIVKHPKLRKWPQAVKVDIEVRLVAKAQGMFRWVYCQLNMLKSCRKGSTLREKLDQLPRDLDETYDRILQNIVEEDAKEEFAALQWLAYSERPLSLVELAEAVVLTPDKCSLDKRDRLLDPYEVLHICSSLVVLGNSNSSDIEFADIQAETGDVKDKEIHQWKVVSFAHFSVKEYLVSERIRRGPASHFSVSASAAHAWIGQTCLAYLLNFDKPDSLPTNHAKVYPLVEYSARHWPYHVRALGYHPVYSEKTTMLALKFLNSKDYILLNWLRAYDRYSSDLLCLELSSLEDNIDNVSPTLYYASLLHLSMVAKFLIERGADVNEKGRHLGSALVAACAVPRDNAEIAKGHMDEDRGVMMAQLLLDNGADIELKSDWGSTALISAAFSGQVALTKLLLDRGATVAAETDSGWTALHAAVMTRNVGLVRLLLEKGASVTTKTDNGATALHLAAHHDNEEIVQLLLENGADIHASNDRGETPLGVAIRFRQKKAVGMLLENFPCVEFRDGKGQTALHYMARAGKLDAVRQLLEKGFDVTEEDVGGWTALHLAIEGGHEAVAQLLRDNGADLETRNRYVHKGACLVAADGRKKHWA